MNKRLLIAVLAIIVAVLLIGQAVVYYANPYSASIEVKKINDSEVEYSYNSNISLDCNIISLSGTKEVSAYYAYYDPDYICGHGLTMDYVKDNLELLKKHMSNDGLTLNLVNASELKNVMSTVYDCAIIITSGSFPDTVYEGKPTDLIFKWLKNGGTMYWMNGKIGYYYSQYKAETYTCVTNPDVLFFGRSDVNRTDWEFATSREYEKGSISDTLGAYYSECSNGLNVNNLNVPYLTFDNKVDGYHSVTICKYHDGKGSICAFGGYLYSDMIVPVLQVIESRISYGSEVIDHTVVSGNNTGVLKIGANANIFSYIGQMESVWRRSCSV